MQMGFTFERAVEILTERKCTMKEVESEVLKPGIGVMMIKCLSIEGPRLYGRKEVYDRRQYSDTGPEVGLFIDAYGMSYGGTGVNHKTGSEEEFIAKLFG